MTKKILLEVGILLLFTVSAIAGPFGLSMGMKKSDFKGGLKEITPYIYIVNSVPKTHSAFDSYVVIIGPTCGLSKIKAIGKEIKTSSYGVELKRKFDAMEAKLKKTYGKNERIDFLRSGSIWDKPRDWMPGIIKKERVLIAAWDKNTGSTLKGDLENIALGVAGKSSSKGFIVLEYSFTNHNACKAEIAALEDGSL